MSVRKRPRVVPAGELSSVLAKSAALVQPVVCDLKQFYRDFNSVSISGEDDFRQICLTEGMSCNHTCGWEHEKDSSKTKMLR